MYFSKQNDADLLLCKPILQAPIVEIVMQVAVAGAELKFMQKFFVIHDIQGIKNVETLLLRLEECVLHEVNRIILGGHIVQKICRLYKREYGYIMYSLTLTKLCPPADSLFKIWDGKR